MKKIRFGFPCYLSNNPNYGSLKGILGILIYLVISVQLLAQLKINEEIINEYDSIYSLIPTMLQEGILESESQEPYGGVAIFVESNVEILWYDTTYLSSAFMELDKGRLDSLIHSELYNQNGLEMGNPGYSYCSGKIQKGVLSINIATTSVSFIFRHNISSNSTTTSFMHSEGLLNWNGDNNKQLKREPNDDPSTELNFLIDDQHLVLNTSNFMSEKDIYGYNKIRVKPYYIANGAIKIRRKFQYYFKLKYNQPAKVLVYGQAVQLLDEDFRKRIPYQIDRNSDGLLQQSEIDSVTSLDLREIDNFEDLKLFTNLKSLGIGPTKSKVIDLSTLPFLQKLNLTYSGLEEIKLSNQLDSISIFGGHLKILDVTNLKKLKYLSIQRSAITDLDLSKSEHLKTLVCTGNDSLQSLYLGYKPMLKKLDVSKNPYLDNLNVSESKSIEELVARSCSLKELDVSSLTNLRNLSINDNQLDFLNVSGNHSLESLGCNKNNLTSLDLSSNASLKHTDVGGNSLDSFNISSCPLIEHLSVWGNSLKRMDLTKNDKLKFLHFGNNKIDSISLLNHSYLTRVVADSNPLKYLDLSGAPNVLALQCKSSADLRIDVSNDTLRIKRLNCTDNIYIKETNKKWYKKKPLPKSFYGLMKRANEKYEQGEYSESQIIYEKGFALDEPNIDQLYGAACASALSGNMIRFKSYMSMCIEKGFIDLEGYKTNVHMIEFKRDSVWIQVLADLTNSVKTLEESFSKIKQCKYLNLIPFKSNGLWGYLDGSSKNVIVEPKFESVSLGGAKLLIEPIGQAKFMIDSLGRSSAYNYKRKREKKEKEINVDYIRYEEYVNQDPDFKGFEIKGNIVYISQEYNIKSPYLDKDKFWGLFLGPYKINGKNYAIVQKDSICGMISEEGIPNKKFGFNFKAIGIASDYKGDGELFEFVDHEGNHGYIDLSGNRKFVNAFESIVRKNNHTGGKEIVRSKNQWGVFDFSNMSWLLKPISKEIIKIDFSNYCRWDEKDYCSSENAINFYFLVRDEKGNEYYIDENHSVYLPE